MKARFALGLPVDSPRESGELAALAEDAGFEMLSVPDSSSLMRDCYVTLALMALRTRRARIGTLVTNPLTRHPAVTAGEEPLFVDVDVLVPIWLDDSVEHWKSAHASEVKKKMAADFRGVTSGSKEYQQKLTQLIHALNPKSWPPKPLRSVG